MLQYCIASLSCVYKRLYSICSRNAQKFHGASEHESGNPALSAYSPWKDFFFELTTICSFPSSCTESSQFTDFSHSFQILFQKYILVLVIKSLKFIKTDSTLHNIKVKLELVSSCSFSGIYEQAYIVPAHSFHMSFPWNSARLPSFCPVSL